MHAASRVEHASKLDAFVSYYDTDARFFSGGTITQGRDAVLARYRKRYQAEGKEMGTLAFRGCGSRDADTDGRAGAWALGSDDEKRQAVRTVHA